jgi:hypothetical protein
LHDFINGANAHPEAIGYLFSRDSIQKHLLDDGYVLIAKPAARVAFSPVVYEANFPLVLGISGQCHPFKIDREIVDLNSINMIDGERRIETIAECRRNKSVNEKFMSFPVKPACYV